MCSRFIADGIIADLSVLETLPQKDTASVVIFSDTHEAKDAVKWILSSMPFDVCLFAGDGIPDILNAAMPPVVFLVRGNCDIASYPLPQQIHGNNTHIIIPVEQHITIAGLPIFLTHGHTYTVTLDTVRLRNAAKAAQCKVAVYGHTHKQAFDRIDGISCINGGSPQYPRNSTAGFAHITIRNKGTTSVDFYELHKSAAANFSAQVHTSYTI